MAAINLSKPNTTVPADEQQILSRPYLDELNEQQRQAVEYLDGPQLVIAGAGSGKTRVLAYKIVHLLANGYAPWRIMALTFTNKAAREMRERVANLMGDKTASRLVMGTFHSVFSRIIRQHAQALGLKASYTIYDASDSKNLIKTIIKEMKLDDKVYKPGAVASAISMAKNAMVSPQSYIADREIQIADTAAGRPLTGRIYANYCARLRKADALDFDDLLYFMNILLRDNPDILHHYEEYFQYVLVDEYQDTNFAQHLIIDQLCRTSQGLCVVGDDAQSIYSFRGANIANILGLGNTFPKLRTFKLERNYRSTQNIINAAGSLIAANRNQIPKKVFSQNAVGAPVEVVRAYSDFEESFLVASKITELKVSQGSGYEDFAILYRTNAQSRVLEEALRKRDIPYRIYGGLSFYQRKEVKDVVAYLRVILNPDDEEALKRIVNFPTRGIGETTMGKMRTAMAQHPNASLWDVMNSPTDFDVKIAPATMRKLEAFTQMIQQLQRLNLSGASAYDVALKMYQLTGLGTLYQYDRTPENISKHENLTEFLAGVHEFVQTAREEADETINTETLNENRKDTLEQYLAQISLATDVDQGDYDNEEGTGRVTLMTIHAAKGLEYENVFIVGVEDNLLPLSLSKDSPDQIEEERRLLYVAITRAKRRCMISYAQSRFRNGKTEFTRISPFIKDIDGRCLKISTGADFEKTTSKPRFDYSRFEPGKASAQTPHRITTPPPDSTTHQTGVENHDTAKLAEGVKIRHDRFGQGTIVDLDLENAMGARIKVKFSDNSIKTLLLKYAKFTITT